MTKGFTLIELVIVIVLLGILAAVAAPRFLNVASDAKVAALENIAGQMEATAKLAFLKASAQGLKPQSSNPGSGQSELIVDFGFGSVELMFNNLCPESEGELGDSLDFIDFMNITLDEQLEYRSDNQYSLIGYALPASGTPTNEGCYVLYDSFAAPTCTFTVVDDDC